jgi:4-hydroxyphenylpyruvate dioxygenase
VTFPSRPAGSARVDRAERARTIGRTTVTSSAQPDNDIHLLGWDSLELWVGNARTTAGFLMSAFGFQCTGYAGPETGVPSKVSYVLEAGTIRLVVSGGLDADSPIVEHVHRHGDGVHDLAWLVHDVRVAYDLAVARGARGVREPWVERTDAGSLELAQIATFGDTVHTYVDRSRFGDAILAPGYVPDDLPHTSVGPDVGLRAIDHVVGNVEQGQLDRWVAFYRDVLGFTPLQHFDEDQIRTEHSALKSTVVSNGGVTMPLNEPADGLKRSQIQEYIEHYDGAGVQHIALRTDDIVATVSALRDRGVRFMGVPDTYYAAAKERLAAFHLPWSDLQRLNILADQDHDGYLLQIFTETITDRPAVFIEIIERRGAEGFGEGNFKALFEAIERDQARRGNL